MRNEILQGDVLEVIKTIPANSVNCIITSPPYFGLRDYNLPPTAWPEVSYTPMAGLPEITIPPMTCCLGLEDGIEAYVGHMVLIWRGLWRVMADSASGWLNLGDSYAASGGHTKSGDNAIVGNTRKGVANLGSTSIPNGLKPKDLIGIPWRVALALQADGWYLRSDIIFAKKNPMPESVTDRPTKAHEYVFLLTKNAKYWYDMEAIREDNSENSHGSPNINPGKKSEMLGNSGSKTSLGFYKKETANGRNKRTVWSIATRPFKPAHFAVMPEALVEPCILAGCPGRVCVECGEPWVRVAEKEAVSPPDRWGDKPIRYLAASEAGQGQKSLISSNLGMQIKTKTTGFVPTCTCNAPHQPGIVLDPFFGAGTVGVVAKRLKRHWLGVELNPEYAEMAQRRIEQTQEALFVIAG